MSIVGLRPLKVERARKEERETQRRLVPYDTSGFGGRAESSFVQQQEPGLALLLSVEKQQPQRRPRRAFAERGLQLYVTGIFAATLAMGGAGFADRP